jgi:hypothetical protein
LSSKTHKVPTNWNLQYKIGGWVALITAILFRRNIGAEYYLLRTTGIINSGPVDPPTTVRDWFTLLQSNTFVGLVMFEVFDLVNYALVGLIYIALYFALRNANKIWSGIAAACGLVGMAVYFLSNQALSILSLSNQYATATTEAHKSSLIGAGERLLTIHNPAVMQQGFMIHLSLFLVILAGLIFSIIMLRNNVFSKRVAIIGILAHGIGMGIFPAIAFIPDLAFIPPSISAIFLLVWYIMVGLRLLRSRHIKTSTN